MEKNVNVTIHKRNILLVRHHNMWAPPFCRVVHIVGPTSLSFLLHSQQQAQHTTNTHAAHSRAS